MAGTVRNSSLVDVENGGAVDGQTMSMDAGVAAGLSLQLANRKFNLALCLAAKGSSAVPSGGQPDTAAIEKARRLMLECATLAADRKDATGDQRHFEYQLALAALERDQGSRRQRDAGKALERAEHVVLKYRGDVSGGVSSGGGLRALSTGLPRGSLLAPVAILEQQLLAARGELCRAEGDPEAAIEHWTKAVIGCGNKMDVGAVRASLLGLKDVATNGMGGRFSDDLLVALGLPIGPKDDSDFVLAVDAACKRLDGEARLAGNVAGVGVGGPPSTDVDLCFVMDCTRSVRAAKSEIEVVGHGVLRAVVRYMATYPAPNASSALITQ